MNQRAPTYVLITPARNEEGLIELTIKSVLQQTVRPTKWVIVSDGSTDRTDEIVKAYIADNDWIELLRMPDRRIRDFEGKALSFQAGWERVKHLKSDLIGNLDADVSFEHDLFSLLLGRFATNPRLGIGGPAYSEHGRIYDFRFSNIEHVPGQCQLFRRECLEAVGGYAPIKAGGIDLVAAVTARMKGWQTRTFPEQMLVHHRAMGAAMHTGLEAKFRLGEREYVLGGHWLWEVCRSLYQMTRAPLITGGATMLGGYVWAMLRRVERPVSRDLVQFQRREQMERLKAFLLGVVEVRGRDGEGRTRVKGKKLV
jgi:biofilm PGA synthesis N-glycosyltransferase PgaC